MSTRHATAGRWTATETAPRVATCRVAFDGIPVWLPTRAQLLEAIEAQVSATPGTVRPVRLFTLNPEILTFARRDPRYARTLARGEWNVVDGVGLTFALRWRARRMLPQGVDAGERRHPGSELIFDLIAAAARVSRPVLLIGGTRARVEKACHRLREVFPSLVVEGFAPDFVPDLPFREQALLERKLAKLRPVVVVVCLGAPKQERWIEASLGCLTQADVRVAAGLGGTVDFLSGEVRRAPSWIRRAGVEWLFRLVIQPWRWKRQLSSLPWFTARVLFSQNSFSDPSRDGRPTHVVLYAHYMPPHPSASATRMMSLARFLRDEGCEVTLLTTLPGPTTFEGFRIERPRGRIGLIRWLARGPRGPILVSSPPATPAAEVALVARLLRYRVVVDVRDPYVTEAIATGDLEPGVKSWMKLALERRLLASGHALSVVSQPLLNSMRRLMKMELLNAIVAPNGVDRAIFTRDVIARASLRRQHGLGDAPVFIYAGILGGKELDKAIAALAPALRNGAFLVVVAVVDQHSAPILEALRFQANALGVGDQVIWIENLPIREVARYLSAADVGINPLPLGRKYCLPVKTYEYLACGLYNLAFGNSDGALAGVVSDSDAGTIAHSWEGFRDTAVGLCSEIGSVRHAAEKRCALAAGFDRNGANRTLMHLLLDRVERIRE